MKYQQVTWKHYVSAAGISLFIPLLALLLQTGWTLLAHPYRLYQASLVDADLSSPVFWREDASLGLLIFLILCLIIKRPWICWMVALAFLVGFTCLLVMTNNSVAFK
jgi:hypothetical protein